MIIRPQVNWFRMLFVWHGSVIPTIAPQLIAMSTVAMVALLSDGRIFGEKVPLNAVPFTLVGVALTIFLAFRNTASYDRYKEARKLWGDLLIVARCLTSQADSYVPKSCREFSLDTLANGLIAFAYALNHQLRKTDPYQDLARYLPADEVQRLRGKHYRPIAILNKLRGMVAGLQRHGAISDTKLWMVDKQLDELSAIVGGCERLANTPIPFAYGVLLHRTVYAYCLLLPFGLVDSIGIMTPFVSVFVSYTLIALEAIASEIAEPFGTAPNALALDAFTRNIERSLRELCEQAVPEEKKVDSGYQLT